MMTGVISCNRLSIGYLSGRKERVVQESLKLEMGGSQFVSLLGPNGCGKSTLLRTLSGLQPPLSGEIFLQGKSLKDMSSAERSAIISLVLTDSVRIDYCTVRQMVSMGRYPHIGRFGGLSSEDERKVEEALDAVAMSAFADKPMLNLSDGERQRVMIAKALAQDTTLVFLDEPTSHLDLPNRVEVMLLLSRLAHSLHKSILISTHELELSLRLSDRVWLMRPGNGGMVCGTPAELLSSGVVQEVFRHPDFSIGKDGKVALENRLGFPNFVP